MKKSLLLIVLIFIALLHPVHGSDTDLTYLTEESPPENYTENGELKGLAVELLQLMWDKLGQKHHEIKVVPWARGYKDVQNRPNTVLFAMTRLEEREKMFKWVGPIRKTRFALIARKESRIKINSIGDIKHYTIATIINDGTEVFLIKKGLKEHLDQSSDLKSAVQKLNLGRADFIAYGEQNLKYFMANNSLNPKDYKTVYILTKSSDYYTFHKDTPDSVIKKFQAALDSVKAEGKYKAIEQKYRSSGF
jgi:polar amino acid transport system substrate-binding protein